MTIGLIGAPHGIKGELRVQPLTDYPERFGKLKTVIISKPVRNGEPEVVNPSARVEWVKGDDRTIIVKLEGVTGREGAETLKGLYMQVPREEAVRLPEGTHFISDIIGLTVATDDGTVIGVVEDVFRTGANDVYTVRRKGMKEAYIPAIKDVVKSIDTVSGIITITPMPGLLD